MIYDNYDPVYGCMKCFYENQENKKIVPCRNPKENYLCKTYKGTVENPIPPQLSEKQKYIWLLWQQTVLWSGGGDGWSGTPKTDEKHNVLEFHGIKKGSKIYYQIINEIMTLNALVATHNNKRVQNTKK